MTTERFTKTHIKKSIIILTTFLCVLGLSLDCTAQLKLINNPVFTQDAQLKFTVTNLPTDTAKGDLVELNFKVGSVSYVINERTKNQATQTFIIPYKLEDGKVREVVELVVSFQDPHGDAGGPYVLSLAPSTTHKF